MKKSWNKYSRFVGLMLLFLIKKNAFAIGDLGTSHVFMPEGRSGIHHPHPSSASELGAPHISDDVEIFCHADLQKELNKMNGGAQSAATILAKHFCRDVTVPYGGGIDGVGPPAKTKAYENGPPSLDHGTVLSSGREGGLCEITTINRDSGNVEINVNKRGRKATYYFLKRLDGKGVYFKEIHPLLSDGMIGSCS